MIQKNINQPIDVIALIESRKKEIQSIEESILKTNKKSMLFQRLPFYKRRRNRNFDKRKKKFTFRKRDRHFLRTHNFYAKRFFMGKIEDSLLTKDDKQTIYSKMTIPLKRRIKSSKFIYKSLKSSIGFVFDESFRGGVEIYTSDISNGVVRISTNNNDVVRTSTDDNSIGISANNNSVGITTAEIKKDMGLMSPILISEYLNKINMTKYNEVQSIDNLFEIIITKDRSFIIGAIPVDIKIIRPLETILTMMNCESFTLPNNGKEMIFPNKGNMIESYKVLCNRNETMEVFQAIINKGLIPVCLEEIDRISLECDKMTVYDRIDTRLFKMIEEMKNKEIIEKYDRTPKGKRVEMNKEDLFISRSSLFNTTDSSDTANDYIYNNTDNESIYNNITTNESIYNNTANESTHNNTANISIHNNTTDNNQICNNNITTNELIHNNTKDNDLKVFYYIFKIIKGSASPAAEIFNEDSCIGKVIKSGFKFTNARCFGLACLNRKIEMTEPFYCKNIGQREFYEIEFVTCIN